MAPTPIDLSLHSLLPTTSSLPAELTTLAHSLLAQSKIRAAHLKPDEEVGRTYACCDIAVERLKGKYGLEVGKARPPVRPAVYGKLKGFLEGVLKADGREKVTPGKANVEGPGGRGKRGTESTPTSLRKRWAEARRPKTPTGVSGDKGTRGKEKEVEVPGYAMPMIRHLCMNCRVEKAAPHVFTGLSVVLREEMGRPQKGAEESRTPESGRKRKRAAVAVGGGTGNEDIMDEKNVPGVILALFVAVTRKMYGAGLLADLKHMEAAEDFAKDQKNEVPAAASGENYFEDALARYETSAGGPKENWTEMEWFDNVPETAQTMALEDAEYEDEENDEATPVRKRQNQAKTPLRRQEKYGKAGAVGDVPGRAGLLPGLGTMFQPAVDWLSEERVLEYERWKKEVGREIKAIEAGA